MYVVIMFLLYLPLMLSVDLRSVCKRTTCTFGDIKYSFVFLVSLQSMLFNVDMCFGVSFVKCIQELVAFVFLFCILSIKS